MRYALVFTDRARRDIDALDRVARTRIGRKLLILEARPFEVSKKLVHPAIGSYRYRVGDYRVIFDVDGHRLVILRVGHRREIYR